MSTTSFRRTYRTCTIVDLTIVIITIFKLTIVNLNILRQVLPAITALIYPDAEKRFA